MSDPDDFVSTVPINLSKLDPYKEPEKVNEPEDKVDSSDLSFSDLDAELDSIDIDSMLEDEFTEADYNIDVDISPQETSENDLLLDEEKTVSNMKVEEFDLDFEASTLEGDAESLNVDLLPEEEKTDPNIKVEDFNLGLNESVLEEDTKISEDVTDDTSEDVANIELDFENLDIDSELQEVEYEEELGVMDDAPMLVHEDNQPDSLGISADDVKAAADETEQRLESLEKALQDHHIEPSAPEIPIHNIVMDDKSDVPTPTPEFDVDAVMEENEKVEAEDSSKIEEINDDYQMGTSDMMPVTSEEKPKAMPVESKSSNKASLITGTVGLLIGLSGTWMAFTANNQVQTLEQQLQAVNAQLQSQVVKNAKLSEKLRLSVVAPAKETTQIETTQIETAQETTAEPMIEPEEQKTAEVKPMQPEVPVEVANAPKVVTPQTPVKPDIPAVRTGDWIVNVSSETTRETAETMQASLNASGANCTVSEAEINGRIWYRVQVVGFDSKEQANDYVKQIEQQRGVQSAWVAKSKG